MPNPTRTTIDSILNQYMPEPNTGCWLWMGTIDISTGYGRIRYSNRNHAAHVFFYKLLKKIDKLFGDLHHECRQKSCVNPEHMVEIDHVKHGRKHRLEYLNDKSRKVR